MAACYGLEMAASSTSVAENRQDQAESLMEMAAALRRSGCTYEECERILKARWEKGEIYAYRAARTIRYWEETGKIPKPVRPTDRWSPVRGTADDTSLVAPV